MNISALIVAAGSSQRMGTDKMLLPLLGKSVILHTIEKFVQCEEVDEIIVVASKNNINIIKEETAHFTSKKISVTEGGETRGESALRGLKMAKGKYVLIHDGARPLVSDSILKSVINATAQFGAAAPGCTPKDTVKIVNGTFIGETFPRNELVNIQTPQGFIKEEIEKAYETYGLNETDDCALMEKAGKKVKIVDGSYENIKITTPSDILIAESILNKERSALMRIGTGFDTHRLQEGRKLIIGGEDIPFEKGLLGHSDADVLIHAIIDSLLGAAALGDIGTHFPDSDKQYKDISSITLLEKTGELLLKKGYRILNIDSTIIIQAPKMAPHILKMRENISRALKIDCESISVKAKTNEQMGFSGRGEGVEARAVALVTK